MTVIGSGSLPEPDEVKAIWGRVMAESAAGNPHIDVTTASLTQIEDRWDADLPGKRTVITI